MMDLIDKIQNELTMVVSSKLTTNDQKLNKLLFYRESLATQLLKEKDVKMYELHQQKYNIICEMIKKQLKL